MYYCKRRDQDLPDLCCISLIILKSERIWENKDHWWILHKKLSSMVPKLLENRFQTMLNQLIQCWTSSVRFAIIIGSDIVKPKHICFDSDPLRHGADLNKRKSMNHYPNETRSKILNVIRHARWIINNQDHRIVIINITYNRESRVHLIKHHNERHVTRIITNVIM